MQRRTGASPVQPLVRRSFSEDGSISSVDCRATVSWLSGDLCSAVGRGRHDLHANARESVVSSSVQRETTPQQVVARNEVTGWTGGIDMRLARLAAITLTTRSAYGASPHYPVIRQRSSRLSNPLTTLPQPVPYRHNRRRRTELDRFVCEPAAKPETQTVGQFLETERSGVISPSLAHSPVRHLRQ